MQFSAYLAEKLQISPTFDHLIVRTNCSRYLIENKLHYFHFHIADKSVRLQVAGPDGAVLEEAQSPLNFEDNLFSALNVLHRLMTRGGRRNAYHPDREFIRKIGGIQASLLNMTAPDGAKAEAVQQLFEKYWKLVGAGPGARACFTFNFSQQPPYTELAELPWEFLSYQNLDLATNDTPGADFLRTVALPKPAAPPVPVKKGESLGILLIVSEPEPDALRKSDGAFVNYRESYIFRILRVYENLIYAAGQDHPVQVRVLYQPRQAEVQQIQLQRRAVEFGSFLERFQEKMLEPDNDPIRERDNADFKPDIVHFIGHVTTDERDEEVVACPKDGQEVDYVPYQAFANCFAADPPALFILQSPEGVQLHRCPISRSGLLMDLAQKQIPYLLSFQHPMSEQGTMAFIRELYGQLLKRLSVPAAVRESRVKLVRNFGNITEANAFGSPTLYVSLDPANNLHYSLLTDVPAEQDAAALDAAQLQNMNLGEKLEWYGREIRRHVEQNELDVALNRLKEILSAITRSPEADMATASMYLNEVSNLLAEFNRTNEAYRTAEIDIRERSRLYKNLGFRILEYFDSNNLPALIRKKTDAGRASDSPSQPKQKDRIDLSG